VKQSSLCIHQPFPPSLTHPSFLSLKKNTPKGYYPKFITLKNAIKALAPQLEVDGAAGRASSFEVNFKGEVVYSKLAVGNFPDFQALAKKIADSK
jgi:selT/selW/selH-like putative selenoprotein